MLAQYFVAAFIYLAAWNFYRWLVRTIESIWIEVYPCWIMGKDAFAVMDLEGLELWKEHR